MSRFAIRTLPDLWVCLAENDPTHLRVTLEIERVGDHEFNVKVLEARIDETEHPFLVSVLSKLSTDSLKEINQTIREAVLADVKASLFTLFYTGDLQDDNYTPAQSN